MPADNPTTNTQPQITDQTSSTNQSPDTQPSAVHESQVPASSSKGSKVITLPSSAMAQIKREEREKGRKAVVDEMTARAKRAGFASIEEMEKFVVAAKRQNKSQPAAQPTKGSAAPTAPTQAASGQTDDRSLRRLQKQHERVLEETRRINRARALEEKKRKAAERRASALEAEMELRTAAIRAGVRDVDYALEMLRRETAGKSAEDLKTFDEGEYFQKKLRQSHPYLYGIDEQPAHTSSAQSGAVRPAPNAPVGVPTSMPASNGAMDARKLTPDQWNETLRKLGIRHPASGL